MYETGVILDKIQRKEAEIQALEDKLRTGRIYLQALHDVLSAVEKGATLADGSVLRDGSLVAQARKAILRRGKPAHVSDLLTALGRAVTKETRASLTSSLAAYVRRGEIFTRPAPNTFGLVELGRATESAHQTTPTDPPPNFGTASLELDHEIPL